MGHKLSPSLENPVYPSAVNFWFQNRVTKILTLFLFFGLVTAKPKLAFWKKHRHMRDGSRMDVALANLVRS
jgi:hypothetical protein